MVSVLVAAILTDCSGAAVVASKGTSNDQEEYQETVHHVSRRHYSDKNYGDGSLKKFFIMLKIILAIFGKH